MSLNQKGIKMLLEVLLYTLYCVNAIIIQCLALLPAQSVHIMHLNLKQPAIVVLLVITAYQIDQMLTYLGMIKRRGVEMPYSILTATIKHESRLC